MKKIIIPLLLVVILSFFILGCDNDEPEFVTNVFTATFFTDLSSFAEDPQCTAPQNFLNVQQGNGSETTVGNFTTTLAFCVNPATFEYSNSMSSFLASNGDELFLDYGGQVVPTTKAGYDLEFKDPFTITGGTGRFEDATGSGTTDSYVNMTTGRTDHIWNGTIRLKK